MQLINISKKFGDKLIFENFSYEFKKDKITVIIGNSGVGKTTLLNIILGNTDFVGVIKNKGAMSCVFQNDRLIPTLTVAENLKLINNDINVDEELEKFEILEARNKYPAMLSAGMSRRVAIIRAMNYFADTILMDEPLRNLDYCLKYKIIDEIKKYQAKNKKQMIIVTHDLKVAKCLADRILIIKNPHEYVEIKDVNDKTEDQILELLLNK